MICYHRFVSDLFGSLISFVTNLSPKARTEKGQKWYQLTGLPLKGLSHEIFRPVFWPVWMRLGLKCQPLVVLKFL
jgi:hypothetical protein